MIKLNDSNAIFDLEQEIINCWEIIDDVKMITDYFTDDPKWKEMDPVLADALMNKYYGLAEVYELKMQKAWNTFETVCREYHAARRASKQTYGVEHESDQELF